MQDKKKEGKKKNKIYLETNKKELKGKVKNKKSSQTKMTSEIMRRRIFVFNFANIQTQVNMFFFFILLILYIDF